MEVFVEKTEALLKILDTKANGKAFNVYPDITHCALDVICGMYIERSPIYCKDYISNFPFQKLRWVYKLMLCPVSRMNT